MPGRSRESPIPGIVTDKPRHGSRDFSQEAALAPTEVAFALECGKRAVLRAGTPDLLIFGEMGIGNTTTSAAIAAALLGVSAKQTAGSGTGVDAKGLALKARVIDEALALHGLTQTRRFCRRNSVRRWWFRDRGHLRRHHRGSPAENSDPGRWLHCVGGGPRRRASQPLLPAISPGVPSIRRARTPAGARGAEQAAADRS